MTHDEAARIVRITSRALGRHGLVHAYGHCSARLNAHEFLVAPARPLGLIEPDEDCVAVSLDGPLPDGVLGEVRIHREIYRRRSDVHGVIRSMPPKTMSLGALGRTPRSRHGFGSYFYPAPPLWDDPQLIRSDAQAARVAELLGAAHAFVMRGNGLVVAGESLALALVLTWYHEDAARVELDALSTGLAESGLLREAEARERATWSGRIGERMWDYLTAGDPEAADREI